jgi:hypothetical protein
MLSRELYLRRGELSAGPILKIGSSGNTLHTGTCIQYPWYWELGSQIDGDKVRAGEERWSLRAFTIKAGDLQDKAQSSLEVVVEK